MVELVYTWVLEAHAARLESSSLSPRTKLFLWRPTDESVGVCVAVNLTLSFHGSGVG